MVNCVVTIRVKTLNNYSIILDVIINSFMIQKKNITRTYIFLNPVSPIVITIQDGA